MNNSETYVWLDVIKKDLIEDTAADKYIEAIEDAQKMLREKVTGFAEQDVQCEYDESGYCIVGQTVKREMLNGTK